MTTQTLFHSPPFPNLKNTLFSQRHRFRPHGPFFTVLCSKPVSRNPPSPLRTNGYHGASHAIIPRPVQLESPQFNILKKKLEAVGMETGICVPGQYNHLLCPECQGGDMEEKSLSIFIAPDGGSAAWVCFRGKCGWKGSTQAFAGSRSATSQVTSVKKKREITEEELELEPLCNEVCVRKVRNKVTGTVGEAVLSYNRTADLIGFLRVILTNLSLTEVDSNEPFRKNHSGIEVLSNDLIDLYGSL